MSESIKYDYFYGEEATQYSFLKLPCQLIKDEKFRYISNDAKLLYGLLLDRMSLSLRNGWYDEKGRAYIYYTAEEVRKDLNCGNDKALKTLAELDTNKGVGLIERVKQGQGKPTKIYVKRFVTPTMPAQPTPEPYPPCPTPFLPNWSATDYPDFHPSDFPTSGSMDEQGDDLDKPECNHTNSNHTDFIQTDLSIHQAAVPLDAMMERLRRREEVWEQIEYPTLKQNYPYDDVDSLSELMVDVLCSAAPTLRLGGENMPTEAVKSRFRQLDSAHIEYVLDALKNTTTKIYNIRAYLLTALYNAPVTMGPYYSASVRHDFG